MDVPSIALPAHGAAARIAEIRWQWSRMAGLTASEIYAALAARQQVFAVEQHCAFQDADGHDHHAWHLLGWVDDRAGPGLVTYLRVLDPGCKYPEPSIGRVLTVPPYRRIGLGRTVMLEGIARARATWPRQSIRIAAQQRLAAFYATLGFRTVAAPYDEDGIVHIDMLVDAA